MGTAALVNHQQTAAVQKFTHAIAGAGTPVCSAGCARCVTFSAAVALIISGAQYLAAHHTTCTLRLASGCSMCRHCATDDCSTIHCVCIGTGCMAALQQQRCLTACLNACQLAPSSVITYTYALALSAAMQAYPGCVLITTAASSCNAVMAVHAAHYDCPCDVVLAYCELAGARCGAAVAAHSPVVM